MKLGLRASQEQTVNWVPIAHLLWIRLCPSLTKGLMLIWNHLCCQRWSLSPLLSSGSRSGPYTVGFPLSGANVPPAGSLWSRAGRSCWEARGHGAYLHVPVQADRREEQAFHVLEGYGTLLFVVDKKGQGFPVQVEEDPNCGPLGDPSLRSGGKENNWVSLVIILEAPLFVLTIQILLY